MASTTISGVSLTANEIQAIKGIAGSEFGSGPGDVIWSWSGNTFSNPRTYAGVVSSLVKKGLVRTNPGSGSRGDEDTLWLTPEGVAAFNALVPEKASPVPAPAPVAAPAPVSAPVVPAKARPEQVEVATRTEAIERVVAILMDPAHEQRFLCGFTDGTYLLNDRPAHTRLGRTTRMKFHIDMTTVTFALNREQAESIAADLVLALDRRIADAGW